MLSLIENGGASPSIATIVKIAEALKVRLQALFLDVDSDDGICTLRGYERQIALLRRWGTRYSQEYLAKLKNSNSLESVLASFGSREEVGLYSHRGKEFLSVAEGLVKGVGVAFKLCGGCNPIIDRAGEAKKIETIVKRTGLATVLSPDETEIVLMIVVGGRARCCVEKEETLTAISEYFVVKGEVPELMSYERQVWAILVRLVKKVNLTKGRGNYDKTSEKRSD